MILDQLEEKDAHQMLGIILLMYGAIGSLLRNSSKGWTLTTTYGQARCRGKIRTSIIGVIQSNQKTKDQMISKIIQEVLRGNMEEHLPSIVAESIKEALP
ncbi:hypothetical protein CEXT_315691 [Caerostris extrusa]|uniref:Uncharacterized protein n=1 Tax=Caerostris extrusa TaxID=172846 RepID=A0AAV4V5P8_CAEEX|nr:hypothetical protein CEXT_315691 [Caerostris extrusa]